MSPKGKRNRNHGFACVRVCVRYLDGSAGRLHHLYTTADRSAGGGISLDAALMTSSRVTSSAHRLQRRQPAFLETDFTVPITGLESHTTYHQRVGLGADYYVIASRDAARPAHTGSSPASRRIGGFVGTPSFSRTSMLSPGSRPLISSYGHTGYPQRSDTLPSAAAGSPLSPQATTAFVLLPSSAGLSRSHGSRQVAGNTPRCHRASSTLHSPPGSHHHYRTIQPKPSPTTSVRYLTGPISAQPAGMVFQPSRVTSERRTSVPNFSGGRVINWHGESAPLLNVPRVPAAAHGSRPLPAAHASSGGPTRGSAGGRGSLSSGVDAALSLTIDDQAPLDCSRKSSSDNVDLDVPTVLNLTTSGQGGASTNATCQGSSTSLEHVDNPPSDSAVEYQQVSIKLEQTPETPGPMPSGVVQAGDQHDGETPLNDIEDVKSAPVDLASREDPPQDSVMTSDDLEGERAGKRFETNVTDVTLNDNEEVKTVPVGLPASDVTPASDLHVEMTSDDLENAEIEKSMEANIDDLWKDKPQSPPSEGLFLYNHNTFTFDRRTNFI